MNDRKTNNLLAHFLARKCNVVDMKYKLNSVTVNDKPQYWPPILNEIGIDIRINKR